MEAKTSQHIELPISVAAHFASDRNATDALARCFTENAVVIYDRREHCGGAAIARWKADTPAKYRYTGELLANRVSGPVVTGIGRVMRDFPASRLELPYVFSIEGDAICRLEIAP